MHPSRPNRPSRATPKHYASAHSPEIALHPDHSALLVQSDNQHSDKQQPRPAMPSGTVRARRGHPRHKKITKARAENQLEPAVPNPNAPEFKPRTAYASSSSTSPPGARGVTISKQLSPVAAENNGISQSPHSVSAHIVVENPQGYATTARSDVAHGSAKSSPSSAASATKNSDQSVMHHDLATPATQVHFKPNHNSHQPIRFSISSSSPSPNRNGVSSYSPLLNAEKKESPKMEQNELNTQSSQHFPPLTSCHGDVSVTYEKQPLREQPQNHQVISVMLSEPVHTSGIHHPHAGSVEDNNDGNLSSSKGSPTQQNILSRESQSPHRGFVSSSTNNENCPTSASQFTKHNEVSRNTAKSTEDLQELRRQHENSNSQVHVSSALRSDTRVAPNQDQAVRRVANVPPKTGATFEKSQLPSTSKSSPSYGSRMAAVRSTAAAVEDVSSIPRGVSQGRAADDNRPLLSIPPEIRASAPGNLTAVSALQNQKNISGKAKLFDEIREQVWMNESVAKVRPSSAGSKTRPLICQDITNSNADTVCIFHLPRGITYDGVQNLVEPFGEVEKLDWSPMEPNTCTVTYCDPMAAREARDVLNDAFVPGDAGKAMKAELRCRESGAQLFVGDLTPDVTEEMLSSTFSKIAGEPVRAELKRDLESGSPIGYGFLTFQSESAADKTLVAGHRAKIGNASVRVGRAERNTYLYISELSGTVDIGEIRNLFGKFGPLVEEDTQIIRRSYAFVRFKNREDAEKAKRTLDKTDLKGRISVRYAEAEPLKACVAVQFHSSVPRPPNSLRDLLLATFGKYGNCSVEIPRFHNGMWRKVAFVTFHGEPFAANVAALEAVQSIRFVSSLPVCCQFARELIPRLPSKGLVYETMSGRDAERITRAASGDTSTRGYQERSIPRSVGVSRDFVTQNGNQGEPYVAENQQAENGCNSNGPNHQFGNNQLGNTVVNEINSSVRGGGGNDVTYGAHGSNEFVPVYIPISALQHPSGGTLPATTGTGNVGLGITGMSMSGAAGPGGNLDFSAGYHGWANRMAMGNVGGVGAPTAMNHVMPGLNTSFGTFAPVMQDRSRW